MLAGALPSLPFIRRCRDHPFPLVEIKFGTRMLSATSLRRKPRQRQQLVDLPVWKLETGRPPATARRPQHRPACARRLSWCPSSDAALDVGGWRGGQPVEVFIQPPRLKQPLDVRKQDSLACPGAVRFLVLI